MQVSNRLCVELAASAGRRRAPSRRAACLNACSLQCFSLGLLGHHQWLRLPGNAVCMSTDTLLHAPPAALAHFHDATRRWFSQVFDAPTAAQQLAWPAIARGDNTLLLAPTGSGKTLAAFLVAIDRIMFADAAAPTGDDDAFVLHNEKRSRDVRAKRANRVKTLYISPLKALGVDVERNLRAPIAGVRAVAERDGFAYRLPSVGVRSGDTPAKERQRLLREPPDILITTPESLYLMLTSRTRSILEEVDAVIVDEIHSLVRSKRGTHLFLSLERLERLRREHDADVRPLQRIGLSATQRPLEEVARLLGGGEATAHPDQSPEPRHVEIIEAGRRKQLELKIEVPVEDMARLGQAIQADGPAAAGPTLPSIWPAIHPRLVELVRAHRSTMIFVNSRRLAERLASAINELAEEELAAAHHGSIAKDKRAEIEDRLKRGQLPAIVATSSMELGIDMGAVDLVIQIEAPPSIASGIQRIGRSGHQVGAPSTGVVFPKYRGDLLACSAAVTRMRDGEVEETFYPRNPLDVLAQQIVAMVAHGPMPVDDIYALTRSAAPFFELPRSAFDETLDLLAGRYPSDEFSELRPRVTWDRVANTLSPRRSSQRIAIANAGTIPDRGLYGVFLPSEEGKPGSRVGELDEEMVFETNVGDVFLLGASSWKVIDITHDKVVVLPAPGEPGRMPFWRGDGPGRPAEFGRAIGALAGKLIRMPREDAEKLLVDDHALDERAATNLLNYLHDQAAATGETPSDSTIVVERFVDEVGDWRVAILSPLGTRIHAPWAMAVAAKLRRETDREVDMMWSDDGIVLRLPETDEPPDAEQLFPSADEIEDAVVRELGSTAMFASHFRENAARALLLPKRQPHRRTPLWMQRRKSANLLAVAAKYERFPILLETYRECLRDVFDLKGLKQLLRDVEQRSVRVHVVDSRTPSPFAASLLFSYTANFLYEGDAPLAERRAAALALDHTQLRELLGDAELRELLDADVIDEVALELQHLTPSYAVRHLDALHELMQAIGDLSRKEIAARCDSDCLERGELEKWIAELSRQRRIVPVRIAGDERFIAVEDAARYRDALGVVPPIGLPEAFLRSVGDALADLVSRFARTHTPFHADEISKRFGLGIAPVLTALRRLASQDRVLEGEFVPKGRGREWCDASVLKMLKRRSLAAVRKQVEPVEPAAFARFLVHWQGLTKPRRGLDGVLDAVEQLQGAALPASDFESRILPARVVDYHVGDIDELFVAGEVVWRGVESIGSSDGRIALYLTDAALKLAAPPGEIDGDDQLALQIRELLAQRGALMFDDLQREVGGFRNDALEALWRLVWAGHVTNDTLAPLRSMMKSTSAERTPRRRGRTQFRTRRVNRLPGSEGRWSLFARDDKAFTPTERQTAQAMQLVQRYGVLTRELVTSEGIAGKFAGIYPLLKAMEEVGRLRRGYFIAGQGAAQFAAAGADDRLRDKDRATREEPASVLTLAATDPANPYGAAIRWPDTPDADSRPQRAAGARVVLYDGLLIGYLSRSGKSLTTFLPPDEPLRTQARHALAQELAEQATPAEPVYLHNIDSGACTDHEIAGDLKAAGFVSLREGYAHRGQRDEERGARGEGRTRRQRE